MATSKDDLILDQRRRPHLRAGRHVRRARARRSTSDRAPRVVDEADGVAAVVLRRHPRPEPRAERGRRQAAARCSTSTRRATSDMRPGCYDVDERVRDMSAGGQLAGLNFPNWTGFSGQVLNQGPDRDVNLVMIKAYNDWHVDEWCGAYPDRFIPCGILPLFDVDEAAKEVHRLADKGCHAVTFSENPAGARHAEHPHRRSGIRCSRRAATPAPCCAATSARRRSRASTSPDAPAAVPMNLSSVMAIYTLGDLLWADVLAPLPAAAVLAHRGRHRLDPVLPLAGRAHARPAQRLDAARAAAGARRRPSCSASASCAASSATASA